MITFWPIIQQEVYNGMFRMFGLLWKAKQECLELCSVLSHYMFTVTFDLLQQVKCVILKLCYIGEKISHQNLLQKKHNICVIKPNFHLYSCRCNSDIQAENRLSLIWVKSARFQIYFWKWKSVVLTQIEAENQPSIMSGQFHNTIQFWTSNSMVCK